jgi:hypothetical protein
MTAYRRHECLLHPVMAVNFFRKKSGSGFFAPLGAGEASQDALTEQAE